MADTTIKLIFEGAGLIYERNGTWKILMPFDSTNNCHFVDMTILKNGQVMPGQSRRLARNNQKVTFSQNDLSSTHGGDPLFLDLTGADAHASGIRAKGNWQTNVVEITLRKAFMTLHDTGYSDYFFGLFEQHGSDSDYLVMKKSAESLAQSAQGIVKLSSGEFQIRIPSLHNPDPLVYEDGTEYKIVFDNDCAVTQKNDFKMHYDYLIKGNSASEGPFELEWIPNKYVSMFKKGFPVNKNLLKQLQDDERRNISKSATDKTYPCFIVRSKNGP